MAVYYSVYYWSRVTTVYYSVYYWSRVILIHVIPCSALVVLNASLIRVMRVEHQHRRQMLRQETPRTSARRRLTVTVTETQASQHEMQPITSSQPNNTATSLPRQQGSLASSSGGDPSRRATMMLVTVVGVFLLVEVPLSVLLLLVIVENTFHVDLFRDTRRHAAALLVNCCIAVTCPLNFFIYCSMSGRFRRMFCALFRRRESFIDTPTFVPAAERRAARSEQHVERTELG